MKSAFIFPGQGSQSVGMGKFLYENFPIAKDRFTEASDAIHIDLKKLCFEGPDSDLALTANTQPALLCVSVATAQVIENEFGFKPDGAAGHSIGEYAAFVVADVMRFSDAVKAVRLRGEAMQRAVPIGQGGMIASLGLENDQAKWLCDYVVQESKTGPLSPANYNCPGQVVLSGSTQAIEWLKKNFNPEVIPGQPKRAKLIPLNVSAPFHCEMMKPAENEMAEFLKSIELKNAKLPIIQNFTAKAETQSSILKSNLIHQISGPVLWTQSVLEMKKLGYTNYIEAGSGSVLKGLLKKIDAELKVLGSNTLEDLKAIASNSP